MQKNSQWWTTTGPHARSATELSGSHEMLAIKVFDEILPKTAVEKSELKLYRM